jgi:hypothetical protein
MRSAGLAPAELRGLRFVSAALLQAASEPLSRQVLLHGLQVGRLLLSTPPLAAGSALSTSGPTNPIQRYPTAAPALTAQRHPCRTWACRS